MMGGVSLSVPYVLAAAAETAPDAKVALAGREVTCAELQRLTRVDAEKLIGAGHLPEQTLGGPLAGFEGLVQCLAALQVGLRLSPCQVPQHTPTIPLPDVEVVMTTLWSQTLTVDATANRPAMTHGELLALASSPRGQTKTPEWLAPLVQVLAAILTVANPAQPRP